MSTEPKPLGMIRDPQTGGLMTVANAATNERVADVRPKFTLPPWLSGVCGVLALLAGVPPAILLAWPVAVAVPVWLPTAAAVGTSLTSLFTGLAFWAAGGNPLDLLRKPNAVTPASSQGVAPSSRSRLGPPEP